MIGQTISHYQVLEKLGEGGMGVVYKARDTKLDRDVALKFLPAHLAASEQDKARFIQEAKAASALNHPNVCTVHDIADHDGQLFIVMEFVDGKSLRERKGNLSEKQILEIGVQAAEGLAAAHEKGIVHRDIKPDNIMVRRDGIVQIMDFGLAKLFKDGNATKITRAGTTMGTMGYMSPEQVQGLEVDHRTDIFSLGVVLYELLAGETPFKGVHDSAVMYEIVNVEAAPIATVRADIDPQLDGLILECLEKDKDDRWQSAKELAKNLRKLKRISSGSRASRVYTAQSGIRTAAGPGTATTTVREDVPLGSLLGNLLRNRTMLVSALVLFVVSTAVLAALLILGSPKNAPASIPSLAATIDPPPQTRFSFVSGSVEGGHIEISPDGSMLAFAADDSTGQVSLWVRHLNALTAQKLAGTEGAILPFWSHDGKYIGFFADGKMKKILASGGPAVTLCKTASGTLARGGSWNAADVIVFAPDQDGGIFRVPAGGGEPKQVTFPDSSRGESTHRWPWFLPDGDHFLYYARVGGSSDSDAVYVGSLAGAGAKMLFGVHSNVVYADGHLLYVQENTLMARPFDPARLEVIGDAVPVEENLMFSERFNRGVFTVSTTGVLLFQKGNILKGSRLAWYGADGRFEKFIGAIADYRSAALSPDEKKIALTMYDETTRNYDVWIHDIGRDINTRFTFSTARDDRPQWSPDGKWIVFVSNRNEGKRNYFIKSSDGTGDVFQLTHLEDDDKFIADWTRDGRTISLFSGSVSAPSKYDIHLLPFSQPFDTARNKPVPLIHTEFVEVGGRFSPDGKWMAYVTNETGNLQVYISPFPNVGGGKWQVSSLSPTPSHLGWSGDGTAIYYGDVNRKVAKVSLQAQGGTMTIGSTTELMDFPAYGRANFTDVTNDGQHFLFIVPNETSAMPPMTIVTNWSSRLNDGTAAR